MGNKTKLKRAWGALVCVLLLAGCHNDSASMTADSGPDLDAGDAAPDADSGVPSLDWEPVATALDARVADGRLSGFAFAVRTGGAEPVFVYDGGTLSREDLVPTDSSIKPITSALVLTLVRDGDLALEDNLGSLLGWTGPEAAITVAELLAFTSGFDGSAACLSPAPRITRDGTLLEPGDSTSLADCAEEIRSGGLIDDPGTALHYGGSHQAVLASAVATTLDERFADWDTLFDLQIRQPLALSRDDIRYTNNRVAGSAVATAAGMSRVLEVLAMDLGVLSRSGAPLLPSELAMAFVTDRTGPGVDRSDTPWRIVAEADPAFGYGIWLDCPDPARSPEGCLLFGSGANGSTSWIDVDGGYVASLALYQGSLLGYRDGYDAMREVAPLVREVLGR